MKKPIDFFQSHIGKEIIKIKDSKNETILIKDTEHAKLLCMSQKSEARITYLSVEEFNEIRERLIEDILDKSK